MSPHFWSIIAWLLTIVSFFSAWVIEGIVGKLSEAVEGLIVLAFWIAATMVAYWKVKPQNPKQAKILISINIALVSIGALVFLWAAWINCQFKGPSCSFWQGPN